MSLPRFLVFLFFIVNMAFSKKSTQQLLNCFKSSIRVGLDKFVAVEDKYPPTILSFSPILPILLLLPTLTHNIFFQFIRFIHWTPSNQTLRKTRRPRWTRWNRQTRKTRKTRWIRQAVKVFFVVEKIWFFKKLLILATFIMKTPTYLSKFGHTSKARLILSIQRPLWYGRKYKRSLDMKHLWSTGGFLHVTNYIESPWRSTNA